MSKYTSYELSRSFFDFVFDNPDIVKPAHIAIYFYIIEHCNRLGWKTKFGLPSMMVREVVGIKNFRTYDKALKDLIDWQFIKLHQRSKNQYSANIISLSKPKTHKSYEIDSSLDKSIKFNSYQTNNFTADVTSDDNFDNDTIAMKNNTIVRIDKFISDVMLHTDKYDVNLLQSFIKYWTELSADELTFKAETKGIFNIENRLEKWLELDKKFKAGQNGKSKQNGAEESELIETLNRKFSDLET